MVRQERGRGRKTGKERQREGWSLSGGPSNEVGRRSAEEKHSLMTKGWEQVREYGNNRAERARAQRRKIRQQSSLLLRINKRLLHWIDSRRLRFVSDTWMYKYWGEKKLLRTFYCLYDELYDVLVNLVSWERFHFLTRNRPAPGHKHSRRGANSRSWHLLADLTDSQSDNALVVSLTLTRGQTCQPLPL